MDKLLDKLQRDNLLSEDQARVVRKEAALKQVPIRSALLSTEFVSMGMLARYLSGNATLALDTDAFVPDANALALLPQRIARHFTVLPISLDRRKNHLIIAMGDPTNVLVRDRVRREIDLNVSIEYRRANIKQIKQALDKCFGVYNSLQAVLRELDEQINSISEQLQNEHSPIIRLVDAILQDAITRRASDIHLTPESTYVQVRYRIDGVLQVICCLHISYWSALIVRIKVLSDIDIAETRLAQDGHISHSIHGQKIDFRVASFPLHAGENLVLRVLDRQRGLLTLNALCSDRKIEKTLTKMVREPSGLLLVCGPTGSGKTTTLYALLRTLDASALNIMTLEDPIEYPIVNIQQTRVHSSAAFGFAEGVRGVLRQDPDVILVGEVRDPDSCAMSCRASMTGHLVLTSTHADDSMGAIARMLELRTERSMMASVLTGIVAQRLIRKLCRHCLQKNSDCGVCGGTGYVGRIAIFECLMVTEALSTLLTSGASFSALHQQAVEDGMVPLRQVAKDYLNRGLTTANELRRVFGDSIMED